MAKTDVEMLIMIYDGINFMDDEEDDDEEEDFSDLQEEARRKMEYHLVKRTQGRLLKSQLLRMFKAWDEQVGEESNLNCLDITAITQQAINEYLNTK